MKKMDDLKLEMVSEMVAVKTEIGMIKYSATHTLSKASQTALNDGAMFYVKSSEDGDPVFCGFFVTPRVALTINHDEMFKEFKIGQRVYAVSSAGTKLEFETISTNHHLDFTVLRLVSPAVSPSHFSLPTFPSLEPGVRLGVVTMGLGVSRELGERHVCSQYSVNVTSSTDTFIMYDGASTWAGDSGAALLFEEGFVVGMHHEVITAQPTLERGVVSSPTSGQKRPPATLTRVTALEASLAAVSDAASSHEKVCRALLLTSSVVQEAVDAAEYNGK